MVKKLGRGFADEIDFRRFKNQTRYEFEKEDLLNQEENNTGQKRIFGLFLLLMVFFFVGLIRMFNLMVVSGVKNREIADNNRIKLNVIPAPRGVIYDRNKKPLARNTAIYEKPVRSNVSNSVTPVTSEKFETISQEEALKLTEKGQREALGIKIKSIREYIYGKSFAHVLGYMTEVAEEELNVQCSIYNLQCYKLGDKRGRLGLEESYENVLRGVDGKELVEVDAIGKTSKNLGEQMPIAGRDLNTTLDLNLQQLIVENFPKNEKGAVVASDPNTGEILALYSSPTFDPGLFNEGNWGNGGDEGVRGKQEKLIEILNNKDSPLFNRATSGTYPSGSTFKIVTAASGLESGKINKDTEIEDVGEITIGPFRFPNWYFLQYGKKEGMVNMIKALKRSNDIFFYKVGEMVGIDGIVAMAKRFGLSKKLGIDLPGESEGLIPDEAWKQKFIKDNWYLGDTYHLAIGQGYLLTTPLQINFMTNVIANGGKLCRPRLVSDLSNLRNLGDLETKCRDIGLKAETIALIKEGMKEACSTGGTGWPFFEFSIFNFQFSNKQRVEVGCKTGTAEFGPSTSSGQAKTHAWFTVFAPLDKPKITLTVLVEGAGEGSNVAAPVAKKVLEEWLEKN